MTASGSITPARRRCDDTAVDAGDDAECRLLYDLPMIVYAIGPAASAAILELAPDQQIAIIIEISRAKRAGAAEAKAIEEVPAPPPPTPLAGIRYLRELARSSPGPVGAWFRQILPNYERLAPHGETLERALGISAPGRESWHAQERREARDVAICELSDMGHSADKIAEKVRRRRGVTREQPRVSTSREDELLNVICANAPPETSRQIRNILSSRDNIWK